MTPDEILKRAEALGALSPDAVAKIVIILLFIALLLLAGAFLYRSRGQGQKVEKEASSLETAIKSLANSVDRQHAREDKADAIIASMAQLTGEAAQGTRTTLDTLMKGVETLMEGVKTLTERLGDFKNMSEGLAQNNDKLGELIKTVQGQEQAIQTANSTILEILSAVKEIKEFYIGEIAGLKSTVSTLSQTVAEQQTEITRLKEKETPDA